jgi:hypothetical protein
MVSDCQLTEAGREAVEDTLEQVRLGGRFTDFGRITEESAFAVAGYGNHRSVYYDGTKTGEKDGPPVIEGGDCVLKLSSKPDPWTNRNEIINSDFAPPAVQELLVPVAGYASDGQWLLMPRVETGVTLEEKNEVEQAFLEAGVDLSDTRSDNMGYYNGEPRVFDYGFRLKQNAVSMPEEYRDGDPEPVGPSQDDFFPRP